MTMQDLLAKGQAMITRQRVANLARDVVYVRGAYSTAVRATVGVSFYDEPDLSGMTVRRESRDYIIRTQELVINGEATLPQDGDMIVERDGGGVPRLHKLYSINGAPPWAYSGNDYLNVRLHTRYIGDDGELVGGDLPAPVATSAELNAEITGLTVEFNLLLAPGTLAIGNWTARVSGVSYIASFATASGGNVSLVLDPGGMDAGPDYVSYSAATPDVIALNGVPAAAFTLEF